MKLKALQQKWYQKLKQSGFNDIEYTNHRGEYLKTSESTRTTRLAPFSVQQNFEYYSRARQFLHEYRFKTRLEKQIWELHSEGIGPKKIAEKFKMNSAGCKNSVFTMIKNTQEIMKSWEFESE